MKQDPDTQADPKKIEQLMRCDICNKLVCKCEVRDLDHKTGIGFRLGKQKKP